MENKITKMIDQEEEPKEGIWDFVKTILYAVVLALLIRSFIFEPFSIPSTSMVPNLLVGDYIIVSKYSYGYSRYSFPLGSAIPYVEGRKMASQPKRGDVAVFKLPRDGSTDYIKRIIGLPGDEVQVKKGVLYINNKSVTRTRTGELIYEKIKFSQYREAFPDSGSIHDIVEATDDGRLDNTPVYRVPEGYFFVMGDNRDNSMDSRVESAVGFVPFENLVGKAHFIFLSTNGNVDFWEVLRWPSGIRWDRLFKRVD